MKLVTEDWGGKPPFTCICPKLYYNRTKRLMALLDPKKTIVFDVDNTLLTTVNRDYDNSQPMMEVIVGLRALKQAGWRVVLHTARGQGRSDGNIESVRADVVREVETFCAKYDVPYDELIIGKVWAEYYIDDRALRPEEFAARYNRILEGSL